MAHDLNNFKKLCYKEEGKEYLHVNKNTLIGSPTNYFCQRILADGSGSGEH